MNPRDLIPHLFRTEYRKIVSVLCKHFGFDHMEFDHMEIAEDIASDTFLTAAQTWPLNGIPENPVAWLYHVAKNKSKNLVQRNKIFQNKISPELKKNNHSEPIEEIDLSVQNIHDSQLQMMFALSHPSIAPEAQIGLSLRILCGFGIEEIADAFLSNKETINKRLFRAKEKLRTERIKIEMPSPAVFEERLESVLRTIYLLFNEGYYSESNDIKIRKELSAEAIRLCTMLTENERTNKPQVNALLALMCFHASRFDARTDSNGELILYKDQDVSRWNEDLISKGGYYLNISAKGNKLSRYHLEAAIAYWHTQKADTKEKWENILQLYNKLLQVEYSPVAALNRTYALSKANGKREAIAAAEKLGLTSNRFYFLLLGELYTGSDNIKAKENFFKGLSLTKSSTERNAIQKKIDNL